MTTARQNVALTVLDAADLLHERQPGEVIPDGLTIQLSDKSTGHLVIVHLKRGPVRARLIVNRDHATRLNVLIDRDDPNVRDVLDDRPNTDLDADGLQSLLDDLTGT